MELWKSNNDLSRPPWTKEMTWESPIGQKYNHAVLDVFNNGGWSGQFLESTASRSRDILDEHDWIVPSFCSSLSHAFAFHQAGRETWSSGAFLCFTPWIRSPRLPPSHHFTLFQELWSVSKRCPHERALWKEDGIFRFFELSKRGNTSKMKLSPDRLGNHLEPPYLMESIMSKRMRRLPLSGR